MSTPFKWAGSPGKTTPRTTAKVLTSAFWLLILYGILHSDERSIVIYMLIIGLGAGYVFGVVVGESREKEAQIDREFLRQKMKEESMPPEERAALEGDRARNQAIFTILTADERTYYSLPIQQNPSDPTWLSIRARVETEANKILAERNQKMKSRGS